MTTQKTHTQSSLSLLSILTINAWGLILAVVSLLFLYLGYLLDEWLGTSPNFMFGLFFLAIVTSIYRLYREAWTKRKNL